MHIDEHGLIVQADGDGGDTAQRMGMFWTGFLISPELPVEPDNIAYPGKTLELLRTSGGFVRHPFHTWRDFCVNPTRFSRDQHDPLIMMAGLYTSSSDHLKYSLIGHIKRFGRYQNKDWANPGTVGIYIRAFNAWYLWPLLLVMDLGLLFNSIATVISTIGKLDDTDDLNHIMRLAYAQHRLPTPVSWIARKFYKLLRPKTYGTTIKGEKNHVVGALVWYFRAENKGNPEIAELWRPIVERF